LLLFLTILLNGPKILKKSIEDARKRIEEREQKEREQKEREQKEREQKEREQIKKGSKSDNQEIK